jgi:hypothetical protein
MEMQLMLLKLLVLICAFSNLLKYVISAYGKTLQLYSLLSSFLLYLEKRKSVILVKLITDING